MRPHNQHLRSEKVIIDMECTTVLLIRNEKENIEPLTRDVLDVYSENNIDREVLYSMMEAPTDPVRSVTVSRNRMRGYVRSTTA